MPEADLGAGKRGEGREMGNLLRPERIPIIGIITGTAMTVLIVAIVAWYKARERELQAHQEMRIREMEHQRKMKELELDIEKVKASQPAKHD
jgi:hypothetical protein